MALMCLYTDCLMLLRDGMIAFTQQIQLYVLTQLLHKKPFKRFIFCRFTLQRWHRSTSNAAFRCLYPDCLMVLKDCMNAFTQQIQLYPLTLGPEVGQNRLNLVWVYAALSLYTTFWVGTEQLWINVLSCLKRYFCAYILAAIKETC